MKPHHTFDISGGQRLPINPIPIYLYSMCVERRLTEYFTLLHYTSMVCRQAAELQCKYGVRCMGSKSGAAAAIQCQSTSTLTAVQRVRPSVCHWLARISREKAIILSTRTVAPVISKAKARWAPLPAIAAAAGGVDKKLNKRQRLSIDRHLVAVVVN